jgi:uncharacterized membrane protein YraQ (UPF0718 family)
MEPISTALAGIALVKASVDAIKGAIGTAKDISEIAGFIDKLFEGEKQVQQQRAKKSGVSSLDGIGDVATEVINARLAQEQMREVALMVDMRFGHGTWRGIVEERAKRVKEVKEKEVIIRRQRAAARKETVDDLWTVFTVLIVVVGILVAGLIAMFVYQANADDVMVTCRKVKCETLDNKQTVCVFRGANNTIETQFFEYMEFIPNQYECKYDPNAKKEMTIQETLKEIRESQK